MKKIFKFLFIFIVFLCWFKLTTFCVFLISDSEMNLVSTDSKTVAYNKNHSKDINKHPPDILPLNNNIVVKSQVNWVNNNTNHSDIDHDDSTGGQSLFSNDDLEKSIPDKFFSENNKSEVEHATIQMTAQKHSQHYINKPDHSMDAFEESINEPVNNDQNYCTHYPQNKVQKKQKIPAGSNLKMIIMNKISTEESEILSDLNEHTILHFETNLTKETKDEKSIGVQKGTQAKDIESILL